MTTQTLGVTAYPLTWPVGFPRSAAREAGRFKTSMAGALKNVRESLRLFAQDSGKKLDGVVLSSNVTLGTERPKDPGVSVWFTWDGLGVCIPVDRYSSVEANLQAVHLIIEARRVELRHGTLALVRASFSGFAALPPPPDQRPWHEVLGVEPSASAAQITERYRSLAKEHHPDRGGSTSRMAAINAAFDQAKAMGLVAP